MTTVAQPVTGQDINLAARATRKALEVVLAEQGFAFAPLATLNTIAGRGAVLDRQSLVRFLASAFDVDQQSVHTILHGLERRGLVHHTDGRVALTATGTAELGRLNAITGQLTQQLYRDFDPDDLAATRRVLVTLTERAEAHVASSLA
jgi:DNA-binding MarR family transcriptional regulator